MGVNFSFQITSFGPSKTQGAGSPEMIAFNNMLKNMTSEQIARKMGDPTLSPEKRMAALLELLDRLLKKGEDPRDVKEAGDRAMDRNGKVDPDGMAALLEMLGIPHDTANALAEVIAQSSNGDDSDSD